MITPCEHLALARRRVRRFTAARLPAGAADPMTIHPVVDGAIR